MSHDTNDETEAAPAPAAAKGKLKLLIILSAAMIGEAVLFFFLGFGGGNAHPVEAATDEHADAAPADGAHGEKPAHGTGHGEKGHGAHGEAAKPASTSQFAECELDSYNVTNRQAAADITMQVQFKLVAIVATEQHSSFENLAKTEQKARVREAVEKLIRKASFEDLYDPSLSVIKRLIREEINRVLRQTYVTDVILSEYKTIER